MYMNLGVESRSRRTVFLRRDGLSVVCFRVQVGRLIDPDRRLFRIFGSCASELARGGRRPGRGGAAAPSPQGLRELRVSSPTRRAPPPACSTRRCPLRPAVPARPGWRPGASLHDRGCGRRCARPWGRRVRRSHRRRPRAPAGPSGAGRATASSRRAAKRAALRAADRYRPTCQANGGSSAARQYTSTAHGSRAAMGCSRAPSMLASRRAL